MDRELMNKKGIQQVLWPDTVIEQGRCLTSDDNIHIEMSATYHGDHDEFWIVEYRAENGKWREVACHNPRYVKTIVWA